MPNEPVNEAVGTPVATEETKKEMTVERLGEMISKGMANQAEKIKEQFGEVFRRLDTVEKKAGDKTPPPAPVTSPENEPPLTVRVEKVEKKVRRNQFVGLAIFLIGIVTLAIFLPVPNSNPPPQTKVEHREAIAPTETTETKTVGRVGSTSTEGSRESGAISLTTGGTATQIKVPSGYEVQIRPVP